MSVNIIACSPCNQVNLILGYWKLVFNLFQHNCIAFTPLTEIQQRMFGQLRTYLLDPHRKWRKAISYIILHQLSVSSAVSKLPKVN